MSDCMQGITVNIQGPPHPEQGGFTLAIWGGVRIAATVLGSSCSKWCVLDASRLLQHIMVVSIMRSFSLSRTSMVSGSSA